MLGARGSGKTVFLASMYQRLMTQDETTRFFLYAQPEQKKLLLAKYAEIADTASEHMHGPRRQIAMMFPSLRLSVAFEPTIQKFTIRFSLIIGTMPALI